jgi:magnesium transporter
MFSGYGPQELQDMSNDPFINRIAELLSARCWRELRQELVELPVQDIAELMFNLEKSQRIFLFKLLPREQAAEVFSYLSPPDQDALLQDMTDQETQEVLAGLDPDDRTALLQEVPAPLTQRLLELLPPGERREAQQLLGYPEESVGRLMTPDYLAVRPHWTVAQCLQYFRSHKDLEETLSVIYVTDSYGKLLDALPIHRFIMAELEQTVENIMDHRFICISAFDDREKVVELVQHYDLDAIPVVDSEGVLLGTVTLDDVMDVAVEEVTEDFHKMGSLGAFHLSLREARPSLLYRKRAGWLVLLVVVNVFSGAAIAYFEETIQAVIALVFFLPLIIDSGGNAGAQASTLMVRALATGDVRVRDWARLFGKELAVALALGITMGFAVWGLGIWRGGSEVGIVVALSMALVVVMGSLLGMLLPFVLSYLKLDPATASAPLITSLADIGGILIYFAVATAILKVPPA